MAEQETMNQRSELRETAVAAEGCALAQMEMLDMYLKCIEECMEGVQKLSSPKFNNKQCDYLADKLKVVAPSARSFLEASRVELHELGSSVDMARHIEIFKLMFRLSKEIESFILGCSSNGWIQAAMTLTNMSDYVASIGFNLELCRVAFCKECAGAGFTGRLALDQVMDINNDEVKLVKEKALMDVETLFSKVLTELTKKSLSKEDNELAIYLLQRLKRVEAISPSVASGSPWCSVTNDESFLGNLFKWVHPGERLGKGATATVYKVMWLGTSAAKKTFQGRENPDFMKEVKVLAGLSHPNIMSMFCCEKIRRSCSLITELMDEDLHDLMLKRCGDSDSPPFTIFEAVDIMLQIGEGMNYLHQKGFVHRDLKSLNILVKSVLAIQSKVEVGYVHAKVADFGLSKTKNFTTTYSNQTPNAGTPRWMAPEVIALDRKSQGSTSSQANYPAKCDVFSFAMLCYEILTGDFPFSSEILPRRIKQQIMNGIRPDLPGDCPHELKALIGDCWSAMPKQRPSFPTICSKLKYLKYLLMTGFSSNEPIGEPLQASTNLRSDLTMVQQFSSSSSFSQRPVSYGLAPNQVSSQAQNQQLQPGSQAWSGVGGQSNNGSQAWSGVGGQSNIGSQAWSGVGGRSSVQSVQPPRAPGLSVAIPSSGAADWQELVASDGRRYYYNRRTKQSIWEKPSELMTLIERADASTPWKEFTTADGRKYYYNKVSKLSEWTMPGEMKLARERVEKAAGVPLSGSDPSVRKPPRPYPGINPGIKSVKSVQRGPKPPG